MHCFFLSTIIWALFQGSTHDGSAANRHPIMATPLCTERFSACGASSWVLCSILGPRSRGTIASSPSTPSRPIDQQVLIFPIYDGSFHCFRAVALVPAHQYRRRGRDVMGPFPARRKRTGQARDATV
ncbi:hypothetical protein V8C43DRAFT_270067 [Trichoderma afarasin]